jgi:hypothetical protein
MVACVIQTLIRSFLHLLMGPRSVFYPVRLFSRDLDVQLSQQRFEGRPGGLRMLAFHFLRFSQAGYQPSRLHDLSMSLVS